MPKGAYSIARIDGQKISSHRAIVFLIRNGDMNAKPVFHKLPKDREREVRNRFDHWIDGNDIPKTYFHGWNEQRYSRCFCFKWKEKKVHQRLYGFICNPKRNDPRFQVCVLLFHSSKTTQNTDLSILDEINRVRVNADVTAAIQRYVEGK